MNLRWRAGGGSRLLAVGIGGAGVLGGAVGVMSVAVSPLAPAGAMMGLAGLVTVMRSPLMAVLAFVVLACLLPFGVIPVRVGVALTFIDAALTLLLLVWVVRMLRSREQVVTTPIDGLLLLFLGSAVVSFILGTGYAVLGAEQFRLFLKLLNSVLFFFGVMQAVRTEGDLRLVLRALLFAGGAAGTLAVVLYVLPRDTTVVFLSLLRPLGYPSGPEVIRLIASTETARAIGTSIDPNVLGGLLMLIAVLACALLVSPAPLLRRSWLIGILVALLGGIVLSYSRSSWVGLAAGVGFIAGFRDRRAWILIAVGVAALAFMPQGSMLLDRFTSGIQARDQAAAMRVSEYEDALKLIGQYPLLGVGFGVAPTIELYVAVSSVYLLIAEEMGLAGLGVFLAALTVVLMRSFQAARGPDQLQGAFVGLQAAVVAALVAGLFDHYFFNIRFPHMAGFFWLLVGLLCVATQLQRSDSRGGARHAGQASPRRAARADVKFFTSQR